MFYDLWCVSGVYLRGHALHRTRWIVKCGRLRILSCIYKTILDFELPATPSGIKGTVFFQFKQWVQDICHEDEGEKATWQNFGTASAFYICVLFCIYVHPRLNKQVAKRRARGRAWKKPGLKNPFPYPYESTLRVETVISVKRSTIMEMVLHVTTICTYES